MNGWGLMMGRLVPAEEGVLINPYALQKENATLKAQLDAAIDYISKCPCDPDIYPQQWEAWKKFEELNPDWRGDDA